MGLRAASECACRNQFHITSHKSRSRPKAFKYTHIQAIRTIRFFVIFLRYIFQALLRFRFEVRARAGAALIALSNCFCFGFGLGWPRFAQTHFAGTPQKLSQLAGNSQKFWLLRHLAYTTISISTTAEISEEIAG